MKNRLESNIWKLFLFHLTHRRNYFAILAIFFLTLPDTNAKQIGFYMGAGYLTSFLLEIPSGYISDKIGHKQTLIISKVCLVFATLAFIFAKSIFLFVVGSILISSANAFASGTNSAFLHNTLIGLKKEKKFSKIASRQSGNASLISGILMLILPMLASISITLPLKINLAFDVVGLFIALSFFSPKQKYEAEKEEPISIFKDIKKWKGTGFYINSIFLGIISGAMFSMSGYREPFIQNLGFPIFLIGGVIFLSRFFWFIGSYFVHKIEEKNKIKEMLQLEIIIFSITFMIISKIKNPYLVGLIFALLYGYFHARKQVISKFYLDKFCINKNYKATMLSIKSQISNFFQVIFSFGIGYIMIKSYQKGFLISGIILFFLLIIIYFPLKKYLK